MFRDSEGLIIRETNLQNVRLYWKSSAEMFIPSSLWESTKDLPKQIFEAVPYEEMRSLMQRPFVDDDLIEPFSIYTMVTYNTRETALKEALENKRSKIKVFNQ